MNRHKKQMVQDAVGLVGLILLFYVITVIFFSL